MSNPNFRVNFKMRDVETSNRQKTFEVLDIPNFLNTTSDTGNIAYSDDSIWFRSSNGWLPLISSSTNSEGNVVSIPDRLTTESELLFASSSNWSNFLSFKFFKVGKIVNLVLFGSATATANVSSWISSTPITPEIFRPPINISGPINNMSPPNSTLNIRVQDNGVIAIQKSDGQDFISGENLLVTTQTFTYPVDFSL